jgi:hypothetical protein
MSAAKELLPCPVCDEAFKTDDVFAIDIELGACHAACLHGSPTVHLDTGEPFDGPIPTFTFEEIFGEDGGAN